MSTQIVMREVMKENIQAYARDTLHAVYAKYMETTFPTLEVGETTVTFGQRYAKVVRKGSGVVAFIEISTGDIFKPAGWKAPAKHVRGNIADEVNRAVAHAGHIVYMGSPCIEDVSKYLATGKY